LRIVVFDGSALSPGDGERTAGVYCRKWVGLRPKQALNWRLKR